MSLIKEFFASIWHFIRRAQQLVSVILFIGFIYLFIGLFLSKELPHVPKGAALVFNPSGLVVEVERTKERLEVLFAKENDTPPEVRMRDIETILYMAKNDPRISTLVLDLSWIIPNGPANAHYIADLIEDFKTSGKPVIAYGDGFSQAQYLIASHADQVYLNPAGNIILTGYGIFPTYYKDGLEKLGVEVNVFRVGEYKSAVDGYLFNEMPAATRDASGKLIHSLWDDYINWVSVGRKMEDGALKNHINNLTTELAKAEGDLALLALNQGLVDGLLTPEEWRVKMSEKVGLNAEKDDYASVNYYDYLAALNGTKENQTTSSKIGIIVAEGAILDGEQPTGTAGGETIARHLREARYDDSVKGVVLRVNSPGGSSFASERINTEVQLLKEAGKPVVVSMGSYAASGGYWVSANATEIFALPTTITGSIGIFAVIPTFAKTLDKIGVSVDGLGTTPLSSGMQLGLPMSEPVRELIGQSVNHGYRQFLNLVASGRNMEVSAVDAIGRGHVWSGRDAFELGLVDQLGGLGQAIDAAAEHAGVNAFEVIYIEDHPPFSDKIFEMLFAKAPTINMQKLHPRPSLTQVFVNQLFGDAQQILSLNDPNHIYAVCLYCKVQ